VYLTELRVMTEDRYDLAMQELVGLQGERLASLALTPQQAVGLAPQHVAVLWPEHRVPLRLDPLLRYRDDEQAPEMLFLNRDDKTKKVQYLSYTTGATSRDETMAPAMARLLSLITVRTVTEEGLEALEAESLAATPAVETVWEPRPDPLYQLGDYEILAEISRSETVVIGAHCCSQNITR
jgi:hypothetical protein